MSNSAPDTLESHDFNAVMRDVETAYRNEAKRWGKRIRALPRSDSQRHMLTVPPFSKCWRCQRNQCRRHAVLKEQIVKRFWSPALPWDRPQACPRCGEHLIDMQEDGSWVGTVKASVDHIKPISLGGLEWDRDNLRWMCLKCNILRGNRLKVPPGKQSRLEVFA